MDPLAHIAYVSLPQDFDYRVGELAVEPDIALPIEVEPNARAVSPDDLTWDATIAAMLKILAYQPRHRDADYYRRFILAAKPAIKHELTEAGIIKAHNGDYLLAEELFLALTGLYPEDIGTALNLAFAYEEHAGAAQRGDEQEMAEQLLRNAEQAYRRALELDPLHPRTHLCFAHFHLARRRYAAARPHLEVYAKHGEDQTQRVAAAELLRRMAADGLEQATFGDAYELVRNGSEVEGLRKVDQFLADHPEVWQGHFLRGWALRRTGDYAEAKRAFEAVLAFHRNGDDDGGAETVDRAGLGDTLNELAICNLELRAYAEADRNLRSALRIDPENTKIMSNMAVLALKRGALDEARRFFRTILELDPNDPLAARYLRQLDA